MQRVLIAPVPIVHIPSALELAGVAAAVAFGTDTYDLFLRPREAPAEGIATFIIASATGLDASAPHLMVGHAVARGTFLRYVPARAGRHPDPALRPVSTLTDGRFLGFFEVAGLRAIEPLALSRFQTKTGKPLAPPLHGPLLAWIDEAGSDGGAA